MIKDLWLLSSNYNQLWIPPLDVSLTSIEKSDLKFYRNNNDKDTLYVAKLYFFVLQIKHIIIKKVFRPLSYIQILYK